MVGSFDFAYTRNLPPKSCSISPLRIYAPQGIHAPPVIFSLARNFRPQRSFVVPRRIHRLPEEVVPCFLFCCWSTVFLFAKQKCRSVECGDRGKRGRQVESGHAVGQDQESLSDRWSQQANRVRGVLYYRARRTNASVGRVLMQSVPNGQFVSGLSVLLPASSARSTERGV